MQTSDERPIRYGGAPDGGRPTMRSITRGMKCTCPACGSGKLFRAFLKPVDACSVCGEEIHHHRADDLPAYLVIVIIGHVMLTGYLLTEAAFDISPWAHLAIWVPISVLAALLTIQPIKGGVIGLQWALKMHGFDGKTDGETEVRQGGSRE